MTGRYLIYTPVQSARDEKRFDSAWSKFADVCRSLHREGLSYDVQLNLAAPCPHVLITASGKAVASRSATRRAFTLPQPVPVERCRERALEASWFLPENRERRNSNTTHWRKHQARYQELSAMAEEQLRAEFEFWRELELLSGQRQHFKPGLSEGTSCADDEVAA
jgi:hypothetical protein